MILITRHIFKKLLVSLIFLTMILAIGVWLTQSLRFLEIIVNQNISVGDYFSLVSFLIPDLIATILPICTLISVLFTYNKLIADHELCIFRTCGLSNWRLARPAVILALLIACLVAFINIYVVPLSFRSFRDMEYKLRNEFSSSFIQEGMFNSLRGVTVYARGRSGNGDLKGVFIHSIGQGSSEGVGKRNPFTIIAQKGTVVKKEGKKPQLVLFKGIRQEKDEKTGKLNFFHFESLTYDLDFLAGQVKGRAIKPYERSLEELLNPADIYTLSIRTKAQLRSEGHLRLLSPLLVIIFTLIGLCALLPQEHTRTGRQKHIIYAITLAIIINTGLIFLINMNGQWPLAILLSYIATGIAGLSALVKLEYQTFRSLSKKWGQKADFGKNQGKIFRKLIP